MKITRREWMYQASAARAATAARRPNILWLIAENMGPDLGCYGHPLVPSPNLDKLATGGMRFARAFSTAPVCSSSRSAFMTGMYQIAIGAHHHRSHSFDHFHLPDGVQPVTHWLRAAGYYTANVQYLDGKPIGTGKTDLNFEVEGEEIWTGPQPSAKGSVRQQHNERNFRRLFHSNEWTSLLRNRPFFAQVNLPVVEKSGTAGWTGSDRRPWNGQTHPRRIDPSKVTIPPYYPDHPIVREEWAGYLDAVCGVDDRCGEVLRRLETDGLLEDTVVIYFGDNGRLEHRGLDWCYDSGDRVPLIVRWPRNFPAPPQYRAGRVYDDVVSLIDITATTLDIAGVSRPKGMHGRILLGKNADPLRKYAFVARDRCDDAVQRIRAVRSSRYRYIRNFMPEKPYMALHRYKDACYPVVRLMFELHREGKLTAPQKALMAPRLPDEELYDVANDPYEITNLAGSSRPEHQRVKKELRAALMDWIEKTNDQGRFPESPQDLNAAIESAKEAWGTAEWRREGEPR